MKDYGELTNRGKIKRLRRLASTALEAYGLEGSRFAFHCYQTNLIFRVRTGEGRNYIMRLATPGWRTREDLVNEALWLEALEGEPDIPAPRQIRGAGGEKVLSLGCPGVPRIWNASLFSEQPGRLLSYGLTQDNLRRMGRLAARLHVHGGEWKRPEGFTERIFDRYLGRGEEDFLFSREILVRLPRETIELLYLMRDKVDDEYRRLDRGDLRVIHCDLWHGNIRVHRGGLYPFDFEDTVLGYRLHDIAMAMLDLKEESGEDFPRLLEAYRKGYESVLPWPEGSMEILQAGRILWTLNRQARFGTLRLDDARDGRLDFFRSLA